MREIKLRAFEQSTKTMWNDGDLFSKGEDNYRKLPCRITNKGILFTKTHHPKNTIVEGVDGREGYTDWDYDMLYTDVLLMEYIGSKDKNGVEICEGDILSYRLFHTNKQVETPIVWNNDFATFGTEEDKLFDWVRYHNLIEVIGNIHETKKPTE